MIASRYQLGCFTGREERKTSGSLSKLRGERLFLGHLDFAAGRAASEAAGRVDLRDHNR